MSGKKSRHLCAVTSATIFLSVLFFVRDVFYRPGGHSGGIPPDPIPNSAVKAPCAYGTAAQAAGESVAARSTKNVFSETPPSHTAKSPAPGFRARGFLRYAACRGGSGYSFVRRAGKNRLLHKSPADTKDTSTPTGKIS